MTYTVHAAKGDAVKHLASEETGEFSPVAGVARLQGSRRNARILANPATKVRIGEEITVGFDATKRCRPEQGASGDDVPAMV